jgi:hypothetical protein
MLCIQVSTVSHPTTTDSNFRETGNDDGGYWLLLLGGIVQSVPRTAAIF